MKKFLFAVPALAFTLFLAFCQKADTPETAPVADQNTGVTERGPGQCEFLLSTNPTNYVYPFIICGTGMNGTNCDMCGTGTGIGQALVYSGQVFQVTAPTKICVTTTNPAGSWINISDTVDATGWVYVPANGCVCFEINDDCTID